MKEYDIRIFELLLAEIFKNKIVLDEFEDDLLGEQNGEEMRGEILGDFSKRSSSGRYKYGPIVFDDSLLSPPAIRENVLETKKK